MKKYNIEWHRNPTINSLEDYFRVLTHPLAYFRLNHEELERKKKFFTKTYEAKISAEMAIILSNSKELTNLV